jgi:hypothetical protein
MDKPSRIDAYIQSHPKLSWQLFILMVIWLWHSLLAVTSLFVYFILIKQLRLKEGWVALIGMIALCCYGFTWHETGFVSFLSQHFQQNKIFWQLLLSGHVMGAFTGFCNNELSFIGNIALSMAGLLALFDLLPENIHAKALRDVIQGKSDMPHEIHEAVLKERLQQLPSHSQEGTFLGLSKYTGKEVIIPDKDVNQIILAVGTTGAGKSITLRRFFERAIRGNMPLLITDGKPSEETILWLKDYAKQTGRPFIGFNCDQFRHYNSLATGSFTELKDRIMCIKNTWSSDHYRSIAEDYLQTALAVLLRREQPFDLQTITECLDHGELMLIARSLKDKDLLQRVANLERYETNDITGLQAHLNVFINSELGKYLLHDDTAFNLMDAIKTKSIVYFALPVMQFPGFVPVFANLVINDLKAVISRNTKDDKVFIVFDEFSAFSGDQVLNLVNMGRGQGAHSLFGTQGIPDLRTVSPVFADQVLNCVNTIICHRVNDQDSAQTIADWIGTQQKFAVTAQLDLKQNVGGLGTVRSTKEYIIHPDSIKQELNIGEAFYVTKVNGFRSDKVKVKY